MIVDSASSGISYLDHIVGRSGPPLYGKYKGNFNDDLGKDSRVINRFQHKTCLMRHASVLSNTVDVILMRLRRRLSIPDRKSVV